MRSSARRGLHPLRILRSHTCRPSVCVRPANNARTHSKKQLKQIARSIERFGFVNPVLISDDFEIIAGHGRVEAAKMLGLKQVPTVRLSNLSPADRRAYVIADNRLAELAGWDRDLLATELQGLLELQFDDIELTGFSLGEIDLMLDEAAEKQAEQPDLRRTPGRQPAGPGRFKGGRSVGPGAAPPLSVASATARIATSLSGAGSNTPARPRGLKGRI